MLTNEPRVFFVASRLHVRTSSISSPTLECIYFSVFWFADPKDLPYDQVRSLCVVARQKLDATGHGEAADFIHEQTLSQLLHVTRVTRREYERVVSLNLS